MTPPVAVPRRRALLRAALVPVAGAVLLPALLLGGAGGASAVGPSTQLTASASPSPSPSAVPLPTTAPPSPSPSLSASSSPSASASRSPSAEPSPSASPTRTRKRTRSATPSAAQTFVPAPTETSEAPAVVVPPPSLVVGGPTGDPSASAGVQTRARAVAASAPADDGFTRLVWLVLGGALVVGAGGAAGLWLTRGGR